jgi:ABC-2 type transport system permease protein
MRLRNALLTKYASGSFEIKKTLLPSDEMRRHFRKEVQNGSRFPENFNNNDLLRFNKAQIQVIADGSDPNTAHATTYIVHCGQLPN